MVVIKEVVKEEIKVITVEIKEEITKIIVITIIVITNKILVEKTMEINQALRQMKDLLFARKSVLRIILLVTTHL